MRIGRWGILGISVLLVLLCVTGALAQTRTTPVTVQNTPNVSIFNVPTVKFDPTGNTVKIDSSANTVKVDPAANTVKVDSSANTVKVDPAANTVKVDPAANTFKIDSSTNTVKAQQNGAWSVGISGTPSVSVSSMPSVSIDTTDNVVQTKSTYSKTQLWASNQSVASGGYLMGPDLDCRGFRDMRVTVSSSVQPNVRINVYYKTGDSTWQLAGYGDLTIPADGIGEGVFTHVSGLCMFTIPVISDYMRVDVSNQSASLITVARTSMAYLVN